MPPRDVDKVFDEIFGRTKVVSASGDDFGLEDNVPWESSRRVLGEPRSWEDLKKEFPHQIRDMKCPEPGCNGNLMLKDGRYGIFYGCDDWHHTGCKGSMNCDKATARPLGRPGDQRTKDKRKEAHAFLDQLWKPGSGVNMSREMVYEWMCTEMGLSKANGHIAMLDYDGCERLIHAVRRKLGDLTRFERMAEKDIV